MPMSSPGCSSRLSSSFKHVSGPMWPTDSRRREEHKPCDSDMSCSRLELPC